MKSIFFLLLAICTLFTASFNQAQAGIFNIPEFVEYRNWAIGIEPEVTLTNGGGFATNLKFSYGVTPLSNVLFTLGDGSGARKFRIGAGYTFDFIPDLDGQFGAGLAFQAYLYRLRNDANQTELSVSPYIHKTFTTEAGLKFDPYASIPLGMKFNSGNYTNYFQLALGTAYKMTEHVAYNAELGINLKDTDSYISVGATYKR